MSDVSDVMTELNELIELWIAVGDCEEVKVPTSGRPARCLRWTNQRDLEAAGRR